VVEEIHDWSSACRWKGQRKKLTMYGDPFVEVFTLRELDGCSQITWPLIESAFYDIWKRF
jgi:hypothetical protein